MAGIYELIRALETTVAGVIPRTGSARFRPQPIGDAVQPYDWIRQPARAHREFALEVDETVLSPSACSFRARMRLIVAYRAEDAQTMMEVAEDVGRLATAIRDPANWAGVAQSVWPIGSAPLETIESTGDNPRPATRLLSLEIGADYYEA